MMTTWKGIKIDQESNYLFTDGLFPLIGREFKLRILESNMNDYVDVLHYLIDYCIKTNPVIKPDQTISYHSWLLKFIITSDLYYTLWEASKNGENFIEGADCSIKVVSEQREMCKRFNVTPSFPTFSQKIVVSDGVYEGLPVEAVRYPSPEHMTGWWLTTEQYDGNTKSLKPVHYFHVAFKRPDLIKYLALPNGYRFFAGIEEDVWFDQKILLSSN